MMRRNNTPKHDDGGEKCFLTYNLYDALCGIVLLFIYY